MNVTVPLLMPAKLVSVNEVAGKSWMASSRHKEMWRNAGYFHGLQLRQDLRRKRVDTPFQERVTIGFDFDVPDQRRRDGHNYTGTVVKWFVDGMVIARVFTDDSTKYLVVRDPTFTVQGKKALEMRISLELP